MFSYPSSNNLNEKYSQSADQADQYATYATGMGRGQGVGSLVREKVQMRTYPSTDPIEKHSQTPNQNTTGKSQEQGLTSKVQLPTCTETHSQAVEGSLPTNKKAKRVRGKNKCKEVASLEVGKKLKLTFYNNRTVGENSNMFSRHLGRIIRDRNICPLGVSSWADIKEEKLNHMWAAVEDKFESEDFDVRRDDILGWMKELWNKYRGHLHAGYVKGKTIQEALKNMPKGLDKKEWEWLVKEHFSSEEFQARSNRNTANRAKLKMIPHIGSKPIRQIIYDQGGKDGNPPDMATIFFETYKKDDKLEEPEAVEKHAEMEELINSEPSMPSLEVIEKCFGPQTRSHVFGFGGGVRAKDLKGGNTSKEKLFSELHSTREENKLLKDQLSTVTIEIEELKKFKEMMMAKFFDDQPSTSTNSENNN